jgi:hypothetical protein
MKRWKTKKMLRLLKVEGFLCIKLGRSGVTTIKIFLYRSQVREGMLLATSFLFWSTAKYFAATVWWLYSSIICARNTRPIGPPHFSPSCNSMPCLFPVLLWYTLPTVADERAGRSEAAI